MPSGEELNRKYHELREGLTYDTSDRCSTTYIEWPPLHLDANLAIAELEKECSRPIDPMPGVRMFHWTIESLPSGKIRCRIYNWCEPYGKARNKVEVEGASTCEAIIEALVRAKEQP